jgi:hypothetical protein
MTAEADTAARRELRMNDIRLQPSDLHRRAARDPVRRDSDLGANALVARPWDHSWASYEPLVNVRVGGRRPKCSQCWVKGSLQRPWRTSVRVNLRRDFGWETAPAAAMTRHELCDAVISSGAFCHSMRSIATSSTSRDSRHRSLPRSHSTAEVASR